MAKFTDAQGREWAVWIDVGAVKRVRRLLDVDLMDCVGGNLLARMGQDPVLLVDVLYVVCKPEADGRGVTDEEFARALVGDAIEQATAAFLEGLLAFFPKRQRSLLEGTLARAKAVHEAMLSEAEKSLADGRTDRLLTPLLSGDSSSSAPASLGSTPSA